MCFACKKYQFVLSQEIYLNVTFKKLYYLCVIVKKKLSVPFEKFDELVE